MPAADANVPNLGIMNSGGVSPGFRPGLTPTRLIGIGAAHLGEL
jgi:hypothetical protein